MEGYNYFVETLPDHIAMMRPITWTERQTNKGRQVQKNTRITLQINYRTIIKPVRSHIDAMSLGKSYDARLMVDVHMQVNSHGDGDSEVPTQTSNRIIEVCMCVILCLFPVILISLLSFFLFCFHRTCAWATYLLWLGQICVYRALMLMMTMGILSYKDSQRFWLHRRDIHTTRQHFSVPHFSVDKLNMYVKSAVYGMLQNMSIHLTRHPLPSSCL